jgi:hypothetical protein
MLADIGIAEPWFGNVLAKIVYKSNCESVRKPDLCRLFGPSV